MAAHHTRTHTIVGVSCEDDVEGKRRSAEKQREVELEQDYCDKRQFQERRLLLLQQKLAAQEDFIESLLHNARQGIRREGRQMAAIRGLCEIVARQQAYMLLHASFSSLKHHVASSGFRSFKSDFWARCAFAGVCVMPCSRDVASHSSPLRSYGRPHSLARIRQKSRTDVVRCWKLWSACTCYRGASDRKVSTDFPKHAFLSRLHAISCILIDCFEHRFVAFCKPSSAEGEQSVRLMMFFCVDLEFTHGLWSQSSFQTWKLLSSAQQVHLCRQETPVLYWDDPENTGCEFGHAI